MTGKTGAARIALTVRRARDPGRAVGSAAHPRAVRQAAARLFPRKTVVVKAGDPVDLDDLRAQQLTPAVLREATDRIMDAITRELEDIRGEKAPVDAVRPGRLAGSRQIGNPNDARHAGAAVVPTEDRRQCMRRSR